MSAKEMLDFVEKAYNEGNMPVWDYEKFKEEFKEKTAKEMFEKLDYFQSSEDFEEELVYNLHTEDIEEWRYIGFDLTNKRIELGDWKEGFYLTLEELQAINKQVEELGW